MEWIKVNEECPLLDVPMVALYNLYLKTIKEFN